MTYIHTRPWALYNEIDEYAASWLENLIAAGLIANGVVDRRSIEDIRPDELRGFRQVHFFAGIGVWSYAFRRAGVSDDTALWTGSCPCQPFSAAGKGCGVDDERHLWPAFYHLIRECRPPKVYGEQVASKDGLGWLDIVSADMERAGYSFGAVDTCSAGHGAPHIRQRLRFVAHDLRSSHGRMDNDDDERLEGFGSGHQTSIRHGQGSLRPASATGEFGGVADTDDRQLQVSRRGSQGRNGSATTDAEFVGTGPTNGFWRDADWLFCRDGRWRPVEPGSFPLANGAASRVGRLRAYGNAVDAEATKEFIEATLESHAAPNNETYSRMNLFEDLLG